MICAECTETTADSGTCTSCGANPLLEGRYALEEILGRGANGTTYRAIRQSDGGTVAVKELPIGNVDSVKAIELFEREAGVLEELDHPGVPAYYDDFSHGEGRSAALYLVQEYIDGATLAEEVEHMRPSRDDVLAIVAELLEIVAHLHSLAPPVVHRDIKPENVMRRDGDGRLVLIDFGSVKQALQIDEDSAGTVAGTFGFMAPEQFRGDARPATDLYGIGATAVALFSGRDPQELLDGQRQLAWREAVDVRPATSALVESLLRPDPEDRPDDPAALAERARGIARGEIEASPGVDAGGLEQNAPAPGPAAAGGSNDWSGGLPDVPDPPRELPEDFSDRYARKSGFRTSFGLMFGGMPLLIFGYMLWQMGTAMMPMWTYFMIGGFVVVGLLSFLAGLVSGSTAEEVYREGRATTGTLTDVGRASWSVNDRHPYQLHYEFELDSETYEGSLDTFEVSPGVLVPGREVPILYHPDDPNENLIVFG